MNIFQVYITENGDEDIPSYALESQRITKFFNPDHKIVLLRKEEIIKFIDNIYGKDLIKTFDSLAPFAYQADLARYLLLHHYGGWYSDISVRAAGPYPKIAKNISFVGFRSTSPFTQNSWTCSNGLFYSKPGNHILKLAVSMLRKNVANKYYGRTSLDPTGPGLLGKALAAMPSDCESGCIYGDVLPLTPGRENTSRGFVTPDGNVIAWAKPLLKAGRLRLSQLGAKGVNDYQELWRTRNIYK